MGDVWGGIGPGIVKVVGFRFAWYGGGGWLGNLCRWGAKVLRNDSKECTTEGNAENNDNSDKNWMRFFFHVIYIVAELAENS